MKSCPNDACTSSKLVFLFYKVNDLVTRFKKASQGLIYNIQIIQIKSSNFYTTLVDTIEIVLTYLSLLPINSIQFPHSVFPNLHSNFFCRSTEQNTGTYQSEKAHVTSIFWQLLLVAREVSLFFFFSVVWLNCIQKVMVKGNASSIYKG